MCACAQRRREERDKGAVEEILSPRDRIYSPHKGERQEMEVEGVGRMKKAEA